MAENNPTLTHENIYHIHVNSMGLELIVHFNTVQGPDAVTGEADDDDDDSIGTQDYDDLESLQRGENVGQTEDMEALNRYIFIPKIYVIVQDQAIVHDQSEQCDEIIGPGSVE